MKIKASAITEGMAVKHSGQFWTVLAVEIVHSFVTCITPNGGRVSFLSSDIVQVVK